MSEEIVQEDTVFDEETITDESDETENSEINQEDDIESLKERLAKAEALIVKNKKATKHKTTSNPQAKDDVPEWGQQLLEEREKRQFQTENSLTSDTVDAVFRANGGKMPTQEQMESDDLIKTIIRSYQSKSRVASNTPSGGSLPTYKGKTYAEIVTDKEMTPADKQAAFEAARKKHNIK